MKKSLVAVGVIVALGVVWTGAAWYTGKQLEQRLPQMVSDANNQLKQRLPQAGLELAYQGYQRGLFRSHLQLVLKPIAGQQDSVLEAGQSLVVDEVVDHGPFPLADLKKLNILPAMASVRSTLRDTPTTKPLFAISKGQSPLLAQTRIGYSGNTATDFTLNSLNYESPTEKIAFGGGEFTLKADKDGKALALKGHADSGLFSSVNQYNQRVQLTFNGLKAEGNSSLASFDERIGEQQVTLDKLAIAIEGNELALLEGLGLTAKSGLSKDGNNIDSQIDYSLNSLKMQNQDLGSGKLTLKVGNIDGKSWHQFSEQYNQQTRELMAQPDIANNADLYQMKAAANFIAGLPILLKGEPVITVAPLSWKNAKGESTFNLSLFLKDPGQTPVTAVPLNPAQQFDRYVKSMDGKLVIPMDMATELMTQVAKLQGYQQDDASKLAEQQVKGLAAMGQMFHLTTVADNNIVASLQFANGQVTLNGQKMPLTEFLGLFGLPGDLAPGLAEPALPAPGAGAAPVPPLAPQQ